jgi:hypothetical protein
MPGHNHIRAELRSKLLAEQEETRILTNQIFDFRNRPKPEDPAFKECSSGDACFWIS